MLASEQGCSHPARAVACFSHMLASRPPTLVLQTGFKGSFASRTRLIAAFVTRSETCHHLN